MAEKSKTSAWIILPILILVIRDNNNNNNNTAGDAPYVNENILSKMKKLNRRRDVAGTNPGLKIRLSQSGLSYAASVAVDVMTARIKSMKIPDQKGSAKISIRKVEYEVANIRVRLVIITRLHI